MKVLATFTIPINCHLRWEDQEVAYRALNLYHYGNEDFPIDKKPNPAHLESHYNVNRSYMANIKVDLYSDGSLKLAK